MIMMYCKKSLLQNVGACSYTNCFLKLREQFKEYKLFIFFRIKLHCWYD
ncbi:hypothetical protein BvCmsNSP010_03218 [Escherichia coli]|nr:hypothetical protein BvCmsNSP010_03218 [Escherichia coli]